MDKDKIWCFWEPQENIHGYLELCLKTWEGLGRDIIILDDSNLQDYLSKKERQLLKRTKKYYTLPQYADAVRVMILHHYGGIWMDLDTIIISPRKFQLIEIKKEDTELLAIDHHIGWLWASKDSKIIDLWYKALLNKIDFPKWQQSRDGALRKHWRMIKSVKYTILQEREKLSALNEYIFDYQVEWDYLGNSIVDPLFNNATPDEYRSLTEFLPYESFIPESALWKNNQETNKPTIYQDYWFTAANYAPNLNNSALVCLHNSWTPNRYQAMHKNDFLNSQTRMALLLRALQSEVKISNNVSKA